MSRTKMTILLALGLVMPVFNCSAGLFGPSNFDECVIDGAKQAKTELAVRLMYQACKNKFPQPEQQQKTVVEDCTVIWNGSSFVKGRPANIHNYTVFDFVNSTVQGFVPSNMAKDVVGRLITEHLDSIKRLCPLD